jgi:hypothetical protein
MGYRNTLRCKTAGAHIIGGSVGLSETLPEVIPKASILSPKDKNPLWLAVGPQAS